MTPHALRDIIIYKVVENSSLYGGVKDLTLDRVRRGQVLRITALPDGIFRAQALRFDLGEGAVVTCREVIPAGPVVVVRRRQEVAIGRDLARRIVVEPVH